MKIKKQDIIFYTLSFLFLGYVIARAITVGFTHDESFTWHYFVKSSFLNIFQNNPPNANNHMLNSILAKVFSGIFGYNQFVLRLPAVLAYTLYLWVTVRLCKKIENKITSVTGFILLNANPYLLDFFALSRGYAMAHAFMLWAVYETTRFFETNDNKHIWLALIASSLSVIGVSTMLYFYTSLLIIFNIFYISQVFENKPGSYFKKWVRFNKPVFIVSIITIAIIFEHLRKLIVYNQFYFGGNSGFYKSTVISFLMGSFYDKQYVKWQFHIVAWVMIAVVFVGLIIGLWRFIKSRKLLNPLQISIFFLILPVLFSIIHHYCFKGAFLVNRTALFFYPLFICVLVYLFNEVRNKLFASTLSVIVAGLVLWHFILSANLKYTNEWKYDASTSQMLEDVKNDLKPGINQEPIKIGIHWTFEPAINFYRETKGYNWLKEADHDGFELKADYYYIYKEDSAFIYTNNLQILNRYKVSGTILAK